MINSEKRFIHEKESGDADRHNPSPDYILTTRSLFYIYFMSVLSVVLQ